LNVVPALQLELEACFSVCIGWAGSSRDHAGRTADQQEIVMKHWMAAAAGVALLAGITAANAQNPPASTNDKSDKTTQMNGAPSNPSGTAKKHATMKQKHHVAMRRHYHGSTTGAGGRVGPIGGPQNDPSIHQSIQRDSRGTPKGQGADINK